MRFCCLINPRSGGNKGQDLISKLRLLASNGDIDCDIQEIDFSCLEDQVQRAITYDRVLVAGGDGTFSSLLPFIRDTETPFALIPLGTGNDLARELGVLRLGSVSDPKQWFEFYSSAVVKKASLWKVDFQGEKSFSVYFINYISFGFDGEVISCFERWRRYCPWIPKLFGKIGNRVLYAFAGGKCIFSPKLSHLKISAPDGTSSLTLSPTKTVLFPNISSLMGLGVSHRSSCLFDEQLEVCSFSGVTSYLGVLFPFLRRLRVSALAPESFSGESSWVIEGLGSCSYQADGEAGRIFGPHSVTIGHAGFVSLCVGDDCLSR